jgi:hypothetical protein
VSIFTVAITMKTTVQYAFSLESGTNGKQFWALECR